MNGKGNGNGNGNGKGSENGNGNQNGNGNGNDGHPGNGNAFGLGKGIGPNLRGGAQGGRTDDTLSGLTGDDTLLGGGGADAIDGGDGNDLLLGDMDTGSQAGEAASPLFLDLERLEGTSYEGDQASVGDFAVYRDVATLADGRSVWGRLVLTGKSDPRMTVDLAATDAHEIMLNGYGGGNTASFRFEFFDPATGDPLALNGVATFNDLDRNWYGDVEAVTLDADSFSAFGTSEDTSLLVTNTGSGIRAVGTERNSADDQDAWFSAEFNDRTFLDFTLESRSTDSGFTFSGTVIEDTVVTEIVQGSDTIVGGSGDDTIYGEGGDDVLDGGADNDALSGGDGNDSLDGGVGDDTLMGDAGADTISGGDGSDLILGGAGDDLLLTGLGDDTIFGGEGNDTIRNSAGDDSLVGGTGDDSLVATLGNDTLEGDDGSDTLIGGEDDDLLVGGTGADSMDGGEDSDTFVIEDGFGNDTIFGGETVTTGVDFDTIDLSALTTGVTVTFTGNEAGTISNGGDTIGFSGIEDLILSDLADAIDASSDNLGVTLDTGAGDDTVFGSNFEDTIVTGAGDDQVHTGGARDIVETGEGSDTVFLDQADGGTSNVLTDGGTSGTDRIVLSSGAGTYRIQGVFSDAQGFEIIDGSGTGGDVLGTQDSIADFDFTNITLIGIEEIDGTLNNDTIIGSASDDSIVGLDGDDQLSGGTGADTVEGGDGADSILGGLGNDSLLGGLGADTISGGDGDDYIEGGDGDDVLFTGEGQDTILGGDGNDTISNSAGDDSLVGGAGDDSITATGGNDTLEGNAGNDTLIGGEDDDLLVGGTGSDSMDGGQDADTFVIEDDFGNDTILGGEGVTSSEDSDTISAVGTTSDLTVTFSGDEAGTLTDGFDTIGFTQIENVFTGSGDDLIDAFNDLAGVGLFGLAGNDTIFGGGGADFIDGGDGADEIDADLGDDTIFGGQGNDSLYGWAGNDSIEGGTGDDLIQGQFGDDTMRGGSGSDEFEISAEADTDTIIGGDEGGDTDILDFVGSTAVSVVFTGDEAGTYASTSGTADGIFSQIEFIDGTSGNDTINADADTSGIEVDAGGGNDSVIGGSGDDSILGLSGNDTIDAGSGNDTVAGGDGADTIAGGAGADSIDGGLGNDSLLGGLGADTISGGDGDDYIEGGDGDDVLFTGEGQDTILGGDGNDTISNSAGDDSLVGGAGNDSITATGGNDTLEGGSGRDTLDGGADDDRLEGGTGDDLLTGGTGDDTFVYTPGDGHDTITDFNTGNTGTLDDGDTANNDFIDLSNYYDTIWELHADQADDGILNQSNSTTATGKSVDYSDNTQFGPNDSMTFQGASADGSSFTSENTGVQCFVTGTRILTIRGEVPIEYLRVGDLVVTRDNGPQRLLWSGMRRLDQADLEGAPQLRPVEIAAGAFGNDRPLIVSPQHSVLLALDGKQTLTRAVHLARLRGGLVRQRIGCRRVTYWHLFFERHQIVFSNGLASESLFPGPYAIDSLSNAARAELAELLPDIALIDNPDAVRQAYGDSARDYSRTRLLPDHVAAFASAD